LIDWPALEAKNARLNAFIDFDREARGGEGALAGLTIGVKSNIAVEGLPWTAGMALRRAVIAERDAEVVARLRAAGAAILGTLNMHEAALGATTDNAWFGRTINAHRDGHTPGGSSGGSGAAVAAGLCDAALGTDTLGSVRIPAAYNGVYGLKSGAGAVSDDGLVALHRGFDAIGPLARSLDTLDAVWRVMSGDTSAASAAWRIATLEGLGGVTCEPAVLDGYEAALTALPTPGASIALPPLERIRVAGFVEAARELSGALGDDRHSELLSTELCWLLAYGENASRDVALLGEVRETLVAALGTDTLLLLPAAPQVAFAHGGRAPTNQADFTCLANVAGLPALSVPSGVDAQGLPTAVQFVGPRGSESALIALARTLGPRFTPPVIS